MIDSAAEFIRLRTSTDKAEYDRAAHEDAPIDVWWTLVRDHPDMRVWVVHNKTVPVEILEALARDDDPAVRRTVAGKRKAPPAMLAQLARDADEGVRLAVAWNAKTPADVRRGLEADASPLVARTARERGAGG